VAAAKAWEITRENPARRRRIETFSGCERFSDSAIRARRDAACRQIILTTY